MASERVAWIDMAKAIGIVAIVWGHTIYGVDKPLTWVYQFHVPLFVALSGVTLSTGAAGFVAFVRRRAQTLLVPYLAFGILSILGVALMAALGGGTPAGRETGLSSNLVNLVVASPDGNRMDWNSPLWFLPALFLLALVTYPLLLLDRRVGRRRLVLWLALPIAGVVGHLVGARWHDAGLPLAADSAATLLVWYLLGAAAAPAVRAWQPPVARRAVWWAAATVLLALSLAAYLASPSGIDYTVPSYGPSWLFYPGALAGVLGSCLVAALWTPRWGVELGRRSMAVLVTHRPILGVLQVAVPLTAVHLVGEGRAVDVAVGLVVLVLVVLIGLVVDRLLRPWVPWLLGVRPTRLARDQ